MFRGTFSRFCGRAGYVAGGPAFSPGPWFAAQPAASRPHNTCAPRQGASFSPPAEGKLSMLEQYFVRLATIDRIRGSWIAAEIDTYVAWLVEQGYSTKSIWRRVPVAYAFGEFARERVADHDARTGSRRPMAKEVRGPVEQMLAVVLAGFEPTGRPHHVRPFADVAPGFFDYLVEERGRRPASVLGYRHHLERFEAYL